MNPSGTCASNRHVSTLLAYQMVPTDSFSGKMSSSSFQEDRATGRGRRETSAADGEQWAQKFLAVETRGKSRSGGSGINSPKPSRTGLNPNYDNPEK